jgi:cyclophilin family peptidyl-prolyl cis-trans isomerase
MRSLLAVALFLLTAVPAQAQAQAATHQVPTPAKPQKGKLVNITMETSLGTLKLELDAAKAPDTVANFVQYAKAGHFDGLVFHRVIKGFMIQGGGYDESFKQRATRAPIKNEAKNGLKNLRGTIAMARTGDPHSASSQFFINHKDNGFLDYPGQDGWGYCVFGKVTEGMDVVDKIAATETGPIPPFGRDVPVTAVVIRKVTVTQ